MLPSLSLFVKCFSTHAYSDIPNVFPLLEVGFMLINNMFFMLKGGSALAPLIEALRYKLEVAGSIHDEVAGFFN
jgi:hypothetical protein